MSERQRRILAYVGAHPGCCAMDVTRWEGYGRLDGGNLAGSNRRGHAATYASVKRLRRRGLLAGRWIGGRFALVVATHPAAATCPREPGGGSPRGVVGWVQ